MGVIRETLILADQFSNSFSRFLDLGNTAAGQMENIDSLTQKAANSSVASAQKIEAMNDILSAQEKLHDVQTKKIQLQEQKVNQLAEKYNKLADSKGKDAKETLNAAIALSNAQIAQEKLRMAAANTIVLIGNQNNKIQEFADKMSTVEKVTKEVTSAQEKHNKKVKETNNSAEKLLSTIKSVVAVAAGFTLGKKIIGLADEMTQTAGRLSLMVDENETVAELQDKIYASAQRSRASYQDTADAIAKMGLNAGNAFQSNDELIAFMEQVNKQFVIGGASSQQMSNAMVQLTQAMASGALRGEELGSILDVAPGIARNIEKAMGWAEGSIKSYAEEGAVSAGVVKYALLAMAEETNAQFDAIPKTWGQAFTQLQGIAIKSFEPVSEKINQFLNSDTGETIFYGMAAGIEIVTDAASMVIDVLINGAKFVAENWEYIYPIFIGIGAALLVAGIMGLASGIATATAWSPVMVIAIGIGVAVAALIFVLKKVGVSWEQMGAVAGGVLGGLYSFGYTVVAYWWNLFASFAEFFANVLNDPAAAIAHLMFDLFDNILSTVQTVASAIDALLHTNMAASVAGFRNDLSDWVDNTFGENAVEIKRMAALDVGKTVQNSAKKGSELGKKMDNTGSISKSIKNKLESLSGFGNVSNIDKVGKVGKIEKDVNLADENIKLLKDMSERQYVALVNVTMPQTNVSVNQNVTGGSPSDMNMIADYLAKRLEADREAHSSLNYG